MYIDQILNKETNSILSWNFIKLLSNSTRGWKPQWYKDIKNKLATKTDTLKNQWTNLPWKDQKYRFISQEQETDGRKNNWYIIVDEENPDLFIWIREKGVLEKKRSKCQHIYSQQHYSIFQNPRTGHVVLKTCETCKESGYEGGFKSETCKIASRTNVQVYYCNLLNQTQAWRKKSALEIPVNCRFLEEEIKKQIRRSPKFITK